MGRGELRGEKYASTSSSEIRRARGHLNGGGEASIRSTNDRAEGELREEDRGASEILYGEHARDTQEVSVALDDAAGDPTINIFVEEKNMFIDGAGDPIYNIHPQTEACTEHGCVIHAPTEHHMSEWPTNYRGDRRLMERICPHGVGHPDPDHLGYVLRTQGSEAAKNESIHGCDGCCNPNS